MYTLLLNGESRPLPPGPQVDLSPPHPCWPGHTVLLVMGAHPCLNAPPHQRPGRIWAPVFHSRHFLLSWDTSGKCLTVLHAALSETPVKAILPSAKSQGITRQAWWTRCCPQLLPSLFSLLPLFLHPVCLSGLVSLFFCWFPLGTLSPSSFLPWCHLHTFSPPPCPTPC